MPGAEERRVRAARRFAVLGVLNTSIFMVLPVVALLWGWTPFPPWVVPLAVLTVAGFALHLWRIRQVIRTQGQPPPRWFRVVTPVVAVALSLVALQGVLLGYLWGVVGGILLGDAVAGLRARVTAVVVAGSTATVFGLGVLFWWLRVGPVEGWVELVLISAFSAFFLATFWTVDVERLWWFRAVVDLEDSRRAAAELAAARERLRLADDLHDILGNALEVVAFTSELAARLQDVDDDRARAEMERVQQVARGALSEVRALVRDTRTRA